MDFYVYLPHTTLSWEALRWAALGLSVKQVPYEKKEHNKYKKMPDLFRMYEGELEEVPFQIMVMIKPTFESVLPYFGSSICKVWWKGGEVKTTTDFLMGVYNKKIYMQEGYLETDYHIEKMKKYFPEYTLSEYGELSVDKKILAEQHNISSSVWAFDKLMIELTENNND